MSEEQAHGLLVCILLKVIDEFFGLDEFGTKPVIIVASLLLHGTDSVDHAIDHLVEDIELEEVQWTAHSPVELIVVAECDAVLFDLVSVVLVAFSHVCVLDSVQCIRLELVRHIGSA